MSVAVLNQSERVAPSARLGARARISVGCLSLGSIALLAVATWLEPSSSGMGTHSQLGIPPCSWPTGAGLPCPSCGMTTAFALAADGRLIESARVQPMGFALAIGVSGLAVAAGYAAATGSRILGSITRVMSGRFWWFLGGSVILAWGYKILVFRGLIP